MEKTKALASMAVFRELYDHKKDIYEIIAEFLREIICVEIKGQFDLVEITDMLNNKYNFDIPPAVIKTALKRIGGCKLAHGTYTVEEIAQKQRADFQKQYSILEKENLDIINRLCIYTEQVSKGNVEINKQDIEREFCNYLLNENFEGKYINYISSFVINLKKDTGKYIEVLNKIKEGVVLYEGLQYNTSVNDIGSWNKPLNIFLETEILFSLAGYNGGIHFNIVNELFKYIAEINRKKPGSISKKVINLYYFEDVFEEIEYYFKKAEDILRKAENINPSKTAMISIIRECKSPSDILSKKEHFYRLLQSKGIGLYKFEAYNEKNHEYNLEDINVLGEDVKENNYKIIKKINYINILRQNINQSNFEDVGYIILTGNGTLLKFAYNKFKENGHVAKAVTIDALINRFWFKLNKGFSSKEFPTTIDVITKSQLVLSTQLNMNLGAKYDAVLKEYENEKLDKEEAIGIIYRLKQEADVITKNIDEGDSDRLMCILEDDISIYIEQLHVKKHETQEQEKQKVKLENEISIQKQNNLRLKKENSRQDEKIKKLGEEQLRQQKEIEEQRVKEAKRQQKKILWFEITKSIIAVIGVMFMVIIVSKINEKIKLRELSPLMELVVQLIQSIIYIGGVVGGVITIMDSWGTYHKKKVTKLKTSKGINKKAAKVRTLTPSDYSYTNKEEVVPADTEQKREAI